MICQETGLDLDRCAHCEPEGAVGRISGDLLIDLDSSEPVALWAMGDGSVRWTKPGQEPT